VSVSLEKTTPTKNIPAFAGMGSKRRLVVQPFGGRSPRKRLNVEKSNSRLKTTTPEHLLPYALSGTSAKRVALQASAKSKFFVSQFNFILTLYNGT